MIRKTLSLEECKIRNLMLEDIDRQIEKIKFDMRWSITGLEYWMNQNKLKNLVSKRLSISLFGDV